ncbi:integral membrane protein [Diaporthe eres]|nr:integral membrane protein [Diaporthe eres]
MATELVMLLKALYADTIVYGPNAWFVKVTLLLVMIRVFNVSRGFVIFGYSFIAAMLGYYLPVMIIKINICRPIMGFWNVDVPSQCLNQRAIFVADTVISAVTDLAVLLAPIPLVGALSMPWKQKLKVYLLLGAGGVATAASFVRMYLVIMLQRSDDQTVDFVRFNLLGTAEVSIGLICACLPSLNRFLKGRNQPIEPVRHPWQFGMKTPKFLQRTKRKRPEEGLTWTTLEPLSRTDQSKSANAQYQWISETHSETAGSAMPGTLGSSRT